MDPRLSEWAREAVRDGGPWQTATVSCRACGDRWVAVFPFGACQDGFECDRCGTLTGEEE